MRLRTTIVTMPSIPVLYVAGERGKPISQQASAAFRRLEERLASLRGRKFYGVVVGDEYRACVAVAPDDYDTAAMPLSSWTLPGGKYARHKIGDWEKHRDRIGPAIGALRHRPDFDPTRPCIEYYRSQRELLLQIPVR
jgi:hypothetical protein